MGHLFQSSGGHILSRNLLKAVKYVFVAVVLSGLFLSPIAHFQRALAEFYPDPGTPFINKNGAQEFFKPKACTSGQGAKPSGERQGSFCPDLSKSDPNSKDIQSYPCAKTYEEWLGDPNKNFWVEDPEVTSLGKGGERSRQFLLWTLTHPSIDSAPVILEVWQLSEGVALFFILIVVIIMGLGIIIGQRNNFNLNIEIWPMVIRIAILLLFIVFSARIVLLCIQLADVMMEFFIRTLGVRELFNIFFIDNDSGGVIQASEQAYRQFIGCSNLNASNIEMVRTSKFLVKFTNMTYYFVGIMLLLRKIVLWFLLVVSPFLAILAPFVFIRNIGWIWVGVFFQWIFYGPLFSLFLGALAKFWNNPNHIPFVFDFSRTHSMGESVYPTSINILYGGPAQTLGIWNTANYVDTFAEYIISLIMLWTVLILPWWLLRIFRDYCCDGIYAMKNILLSMYDTLRSGPPNGPGPKPTPRPTGTAGLQLDLPTNVNVKARIQIPELRDMKIVQTQQIIQQVQMKASNITDIARMETQKDTRENIVKNINEIQNPMSASNPADRQKLTDLRDEIRTRASKGDQAAQRFNAVTNRGQQQIAKVQILASMPKMVAVIQTAAAKFNMPMAQAQHIVSKVFTHVSGNEKMVDEIAQKSQVTKENTQRVLKVVSRGDLSAQTPAQQVSQVSLETGVEEAKVRAVIHETSVAVKSDKKVAEQIAAVEQVKQDVVQQLVEETLPAVSAPAENIEKTIASSSQKVSIEEYEQVKEMWQSQYEDGEVPVNENISNRAEWVAGDIVRITNIMNKVMSQDKVLQEQGLDEVGFILPIFMVNNLSGEELMVYLKAKLEAAKQVKRDVEKEAELREKIKAEDEDNLVEISNVKKQEAAKEQVLQQELEIGGSGNAEATGKSGGTTENNVVGMVEGQGIQTQADQIHQDPVQQNTHSDTEHMMNTSEMNSLEDIKNKLQ